MGEATVVIQDSQRPSRRARPASGALERELSQRLRAAMEQRSGTSRAAPLHFALEVGRVVVDTLYAGDPGAWRRRERKSHALRALVARVELPLSVTALYRALALYELSRRGEELGPCWAHLGISHLRAVLGLPEQIQNQLLMSAERQRWTVARLEREAVGHRQRSRASGGRRPIAPYIRSIRGILRLTSPDALEGLDGVQELSSAELEQLTEQLGQARARLEQLERLLPRRAGKARKPGLGA